MPTPRRHLLLAILLLSAHTAYACRGRACWPRRTFFDDAVFSRFLDQLRAEPFAEERFGVLRQAAGLHWLTCEQIVRVLPLFEWRTDRVRVVEVTVQSIADPEHRGRIADTFDDGDDRGHVCVMLGLSE